MEKKEPVTISISPELKERLSKFPHVMMAVIAEAPKEGDTIRIGDVQAIFANNAIFFCFGGDNFRGVEESFQMPTKNNIIPYRAMGFQIGENYKARLATEEEIQQHEKENNKTENED